MTAAETHGNAEGVEITLQCSEGRFDLSVPRVTTIADAKQLFKKSFEPLHVASMSAFIISCDGVFLEDETKTLEAAEVKDGALWSMVKRTVLPWLNEEEEMA